MLKGLPLQRHTRHDIGCCSYCDLVQFTAEKFCKTPIKCVCVQNI